MYPTERFWLVFVCHLWSLWFVIVTYFCFVFRFYVLFICHFSTGVLCKQNVFGSFKFCLFAIHSASLLIVLIKIQEKTDCVTGPGLIAILSVSPHLEHKLLYLQREQVAWLDLFPPNVHFDLKLYSCVLKINQTISLCPTDNSGRDCSMTTTFSPLYHHTQAQWRRCWQGRTNTGTYSSHRWPQKYHRRCPKSELLSPKSIDHHRHHHCQHSRETHWPHEVPLRSGRWAEELATAREVSTLCSTILAQSRAVFSSPPAWSAWTQPAGTSWKAEVKIITVCVALRCWYSFVCYRNDLPGWLIFQTHKRYKSTLFIGTKHNMQMHTTQ